VRRTSRSRLIENAVFRGIPALALVSAFAAAALLGAPSPEALARDAAGYDALGWSLASGRGFVGPSGYPEVLRTPGYPAFLGALYVVFGHRLGPVWAAHAVAHAVTAVLVMALARRLRPGDRALAAVAGIAWAVYPFALHGASRVLTETLATTGLTAVTFLLVEAEARGGRGRWALAGGLAGALALVRPALVSYPPFVLALAGLAAARGGRRRVGHAALFALAALVVAAPWAARTSRIVGRPVLLGAGGLGNNLHIAAWEYRDLSSGIPPTTDYQGQAGFHENEARVARMVEAPRFSPAWVLETDRARLDLAVQEIRSHPWLYVRSTLLRIPKLWVSQHLPGMPRWAGRLVALACLVLLGLGVAGALRLRPWSFEHALLVSGAIYLGLVHAPLHAEARYTLPARPVLVLLAAVAVVDLSRSGARSSPARSAP
jgi:4-amino-4-deoxy-L-arabinose transferase-like glycosyltransferase